MNHYMADFILSPEEQDIRSLAARYSDEKVAPAATALDQAREYPLEIMKELGELGMLGACIPEEYGGSALGVTAHSLIIEELSRNSGTVGFLVDSCCSLGLMLLLNGGTEEQKQKYLVPATQGKEFFAFSLTEPHSGSDAGSAKTTAVADGEFFVINGSKTWITNIGIADHYLVCCRTDPAAPGNKGISLILVPGDTPGLALGKPEEKICIRGSHTGQVFFDNCRVPKSNLIGELNRGLPLFMKSLDEGRIAIGAISVGMAQGVLDRAVRYAKDRQAFGKTITEYQGVSFQLAEMETQIAATRAYLYTVAKMHDAGIPIRKEAAMLKLSSSEMVNRVCYQAMQVMGGNGCSEEYEVERFYRDARLCTIGEGTSEICKLLISRFLLEEYQ